jgi:hypothetical protein
MDRIFIKTKFQYVISKRIHNCLKFQSLFISVEGLGIFTLLNIQILQLLRGLLSTKIVKECFLTKV